MYSSKNQWFFYITDNFLNINNTVKKRLYIIFFEPLEIFEKYLFCKYCNLLVFLIKKSYVDIVFKVDLLATIITFFKQYMQSFLKMQVKKITQKPINIIFKCSRCRVTCFQNVVQSHKNFVFLSTSY